MNKFKILTKDEFESLNRETLFWNNGYTVVINCKFIQEWEQLAEALGNAFQLPMRNEGPDGTWDWLTDLSWLGEQNKISLYLVNEKELFRDNFDLKKDVYNWFGELVRFWNEDVKSAFIAGKKGKPKIFDIYFVN